MEVMKVKLPLDGKSPKLLETSGHTNLLKDETTLVKDKYNYLKH